MGVLAAFAVFALTAQIARGQPGSSAACVNPTCASPPCKGNLRGDVGCTTVSGTETLQHEILQAGSTIASNSHIFGPFEAGFTAQQDSIIQNWGCSDPSVLYDSEGGTDLGIATLHVAHACNVVFPRTEGTRYYGIVGPCGGHTGDYHFHQHFSCLFSETGAHSTKVGVVAQWNIYGKWEDFTNSKLPYLDACGAHLGTTPESTSTSVYHYHAQDKAPWTVGCHGPSGSGGLVGIAACRALYTECGDGTSDITIASGTVTYDRWCPCWDSTGSNTGTSELPALSASVNWYLSSSTPSPTPSPSPSPSPSLSPSPSPTTTAVPAGTASSSRKTITCTWLPLFILALVLQSASGLRL